MNQVVLKRLRDDARVIPLVSLLKRELALPLKPAKDLVERVLRKHPVALPVSSATNVPRLIEEAALYGADIVVWPMPSPSTTVEPSTSRRNRTPVSKEIPQPFAVERGKTIGPSSPMEKRGTESTAKRKGA